MKKLFLLLSTAVFWLPIAAVHAQTPPSKKRSVKPAIVRLKFESGTVSLTNPYTETRLLVTGIAADGTSRDLSEQILLSAQKSDVIRLDDNGTVRPLKNGTTTVTAKYKNVTARIPVTVSGVAKTTAPRFVSDVIPVLTRTGCNMGACHGAAQGKGNFRLSLLGYDPDADYLAIAKAINGRRVSVAQPERSLLLLKPLMSVVHKGGRRFEKDSAEYRVLHDWIAAGMSKPDPKESPITQVDVLPKRQTLAVGDTQRYRVVAKFADGATRDVSSQALFDSSDASVATVTPSGNAKVTGKGETAVVVRYQGLVATARIDSPFNAPKAIAKTSAVPTVDALINAKLNALGLDASPLCTDADFLRRASLDIIGLLPTPEEARAFLADASPDKRAKLIDALLDRPEYVDYWTLKWSDILRSSRRTLGDKGMAALNRWIRQSVAQNKPWNQFAREVVAARGSANQTGAANFFRTAGNPQEQAETVSQVFLGVRIQCAKCHNHPYEKWKQQQYYQIAAFFARVKVKNGDANEGTIIYSGRDGEVTNPRTGRQAAPIALDAKPLADDFSGDRRDALADWLTSSQNPFFAKILVNRVWKHLMGVGLVEPVDDLRATNPPSNEPLFDFLARDFAAHGFDIKHLIRTIMRSEAYGRSPIPTKTNAADPKFFSHYTFKRLGAETLLDALASATGTTDKFDGYPTGTRAAQLPDPTVNSYFLDLFGRPARNSACECERSDQPNMGQILHLMNNAGLNARLGAKEGRIGKLLAAKTELSLLIEELYLGAYSRFPSPAEKKLALAKLTAAKDKPAATEDVLWALLNSPEFLFNH